MDASDTKSWRLFFALWPTQAERENLRRQIRQSLPANADIKLVAAGNLHCTLAFLGECRDEAQQCYKQAAATIKSEPFVLSLDRVEFRKRQSMLWVCASSVPTELAALNSELHKVINECGYVSEKRKFIPHVTIARKIDKAPKILSWQPVSWQVDRLVLMRSQIDHKGASYTVVQSWPFGRNI